MKKRMQQTEIAGVRYHPFRNEADALRFALRTVMNLPARELQVRLSLLTGHVNVTAVFAMLSELYEKYEQLSVKESADAPK